MYTPSQDALGSTPDHDHDYLTAPVPRFLIELPPWPKVFFGNLGDLLLGVFRRQPPLHLTSAPGPFWPDVFVKRGLPVAGFRTSVLYHVFIVLALWGLANTMRRPQVRQESPFAHSSVSYYPLSEYLPPIPPTGPKAKVARKGRPAYARQRIVSTPPEPDNTRQTIITPSPKILRRDLDLPNIVAWTETPAPAPSISASARKSPAPLELPKPAAPAPDTSHARLTMPVFATPAAVAPAPNPDQLRRNQATAFSLPSPVPPPAEPGERVTMMFPVPAAAVPPGPDTSQIRRAGQMNMAALAPDVAAPKLPVAEQRAMWIKSGTQAGAGRPGGPGAGRQGDAAAPTAPVLQGGGNNKDAIGRIVALGVNPTMPSGPISIPDGSRRGEFMATPEGKPSAPGTPDIQGGGNSAGGNGDGRPADRSPLNGITVAAGPVNPGPVAVAGPPAAAPIKPAPGSATALAAAMRPMRAGDLARSTRPAPAVPPDAPQLERTVFGPKRFYSMTLNMPNLSSTGGGSWIIRFAELNQTRDQTEVSAPVATVKVDPAFPRDLHDQGMHGVVVLYAVIHADGSVGEVRVLRGLNDRLDACARDALLKWRFRPGTKNGAAVELEAVVQIPFKAGPPGL